MNMDVASVASVGLGAAQHGAAPRRVRPAVAATPPVTVDTIPRRPPREVLDAIDAASRAYRLLHAQGRELRFERNPDTGRMSIEVRDLDGNLLRTIPPSKLLDAATEGKL
jgi:flagellar protein FlaG